MPVLISWVTKPVLGRSLPACERNKSLENHLTFSFPVCMQIHPTLVIISNTSHHRSLDRDFLMYSNEA